jgi:hypothetical protein
MTELEQSLPHLFDTIDQHVSRENEGSACSVLDVLPYLGMELGLQGLACLASSSRQLRHDCIELARQNARVLLLDALPAVKADQGLAATAAAVQSPAAGAAAACGCLQPVLWILRQLPPCSVSSAVAEDVVQRLVHVPHVPLQQAQQLVAAGVRISHAQLLAAASSMVAGVEVWVQVLKQLQRMDFSDLTNQLRILRDIPAEAVAICCNRDPWVSPHTAVGLPSLPLLYDAPDHSRHSCCKCTPACMYTA